MEHDFEIVSEIVGVDIIAIGNTIRDLRRLVESYGAGRWRKLKGGNDRALGERPCSACGVALV